MIRVITLMDSEIMSFSIYGPEEQSSSPIDFKLVSYKMIL